MPVSTTQQLPLFLAGQINKAVLCTNLGNVKCVNPISKLVYCGRHLPVPSSWPKLRGSRHSGAECSDVETDVYRRRVAYLRHRSINTTTTQEHTLQNWIKLLFSPYSLVGIIEVSEDYFGPIISHDVGDRFFWNLMTTQGYTMSHYRIHSLLLE
jgi:hypothetical protein